MEVTQVVVGFDDDDGYSSDYATELAKLAELQDVARGGLKQNRALFRKFHVKD